MTPTPKILAYTCSYGRRFRGAKWIADVRGSTDCWFDWALYLGAATEGAVESAVGLLKDPEAMGLQYLVVWNENRGQHHATRNALQIARERGYEWLLRLDDDFEPHTKRWLRKMIERLDDLKTRTGDEFYRFMAAPRVVGLRNALQPVGTINKGQPYPVEIMDKLGGVCRLHPVSLMEEYEPDLYDPLGRGDPESLAEYLSHTIGGRFLRFPDIRVKHPTSDLEAGDTPDEAHQRLMSLFWPYLGPEEVPEVSS